MSHAFARTMPRSGKRRFRALIVTAAAASVMAGCRQDPMDAGVEYVKKGDYSSAVVEFKNAVQAKPDLVEARLALADVLERTYDIVGAEQHLRKALERGGDPDVLAPRIALLMLDTNQLDKIIREFKDRRLKSPEADSTLRGVVALSYVAQNRLQSAEEQIKAVETQTPAVLMAQAQILLSGGKLQEAYAKLDDALKDPKAPWWMLRAASRVSNAMGDQVRSLEIIKRAHEAAPWHRGVTGEYAEALFSAGKTDQAIALRNKLKKEAPNYFWTHYLDAVALLQEGRTEASHAAALKVLAVSPDHLPATLLAASAEIKRGDYLMADARLQKAVRQHPYSLSAHQLFAKTQFMTGRTESAADEIRRGLSMAPDDAQLLALKADVELKRGSRVEAASTLERLVGKHPGDALSLLRLSLLKAGMGNRAAAAELLDKAAEACKDIPELRDRVVAAALRQGDADRARRLADYAVQAHPKDPHSHLTMAAARDTQNDPAGAWQSTLAALDLDPAFHPALVALSAMTRAPEQRQELERRFGKAVEAKSASAQVFIDDANLLRALGKNQEAIIAVLEKGVAAQPGSTPLRQLLAEEYLRKGDADKALSLVQTGASAAKASPEAAALLASTYERLGKIEQATDAYRKLAAAYPQRADWRLKLAQIDAAAGRTTEATTVLRALISERPFDADAYVALAYLTVRSNPAEAQSIARQLGESERHQVRAMLLEGELLAQSGNASEALKQFSKAAKAGVLPEAVLKTVQLLDSLNRTDAAEQQLADTLRKFPEDPPVLGFAARRALAQGKPEQAAELLQRLVAKDPRNAAALNDLAWAQVQARKPEALQNAARAAFLLPHAPNVLDTLGMAQLQAGKRDEGIASLRAAINLAPNAALPRLHLAEYLITSGDRKAASEILRLVDRRQLSPSDQEVFSKVKKAAEA